MPTSDSKQRDKQSEKKFTSQTVRIPAELEKIIGHRLVDTGESFQGYVMRLIEAELNATQTQPVLVQMPKREIHVTPENQHYLEGAAEILEFGDDTFAPALQQNITAFLRGVRGAAPGQSKSTSKKPRRA